MTNPDATTDESVDDFEEILVEIFEAEEKGESADSSIWYARYPKFRLDLEEFFADQNTFSKARDAARAGLVPKFDGYEIERELGHGGCGVVYQARELEPPRRVALKALVGSPFLTPIERARFRREVHVAARLDHENILPIYKTGTSCGVPYFTMKLATGGPLSQSLDHYQKDPRAAAVLVAKLAGAMHFAHQHAVLHRDLKPSNILLDDRREPFVADFGLVSDLADPDELTQTKELLGTIPYMAPERTVSRVASTVAVDVYGLGCILYACLTGKAPFEGASELDTLLKVKQDVPVPPARVNPSVPRDLDAICRKCLEKDPARRYPSAADLANDLDRYLSNLPTEARPPGLVRKLTTSMRRHPAITTVALLIAMFVAAGTFAVIVHEARLSTLNENLSTANSNLLNVNSELEQRSDDLAKERTVILEREAQLRTQTHADRLRYAARLLEGFSRVEAIKVLDEILPEENRQGGPSFAWSYLRREAEQEFGEITLPEGEARSVAFSGDKKLLAVGDQKGSVHLYDAVSLKKIRQLDGLVGDVYRIAFSPNSTHVVAVSEQLSPVIWFVKTGIPVAGKPPHFNDALDVAWGVQENTVVSAGSDGTSWIWREGTLTDRRVKIFEQQDGLKSAAVFPDRRLVVVKTHEVSAPIVTNLDTGVQWAIEGYPAISRLRRLPDGRLLMLGFSGWVHIIDPLHPKRGSVTVSANDGPHNQVGEGSTAGFIAAGTQDGVIQLWDLAKPGTQVRINAHTGKLRDLAFHPDGKILASAAADGRVRLWDVPTIRRRHLPWSSSGTIDSLAFDPRSGHLIIGCRECLWVRNMGAGQTIGRTDSFETDCMSGPVRQLAVSKDGTIFAAIGGEPVVRYASKGLSIDWRSDFSPGSSGVGLSPDGKTVWCRHTDGMVRGRDPETGELTAEWPASVDGDGPIAVHAGGKVIAIRSTRGLAHILDANTGEIIQKFEGHGYGKAPLAFSPDGRILAVVEGSTVILWEWETKKKLHELTDRGRDFSTLAFTPDSLELATGTSSGSISVWRVTSGQRLLSFQDQQGAVSALAFHPKGDYLASAVIVPTTGRTELHCRWTTPIKRPR